MDEDNINSQKYSYAISSKSTEWDDDQETLSDDGDMFTQEEAEHMFRDECRKWLKENGSKLTAPGWENAYKKPWIQKKK